MDSHIELKEFIDIALDVTQGLAAIHPKELYKSTLSLLKDDCGLES
jgi:hypothetical protein